MNTIKLHIDEKKQQFIIAGKIENIVSHRRAKHFFLHDLHAKLHGDEKITISYEEEEKEPLLNKIERALDKYGIERSDSSEIKKVLKSYYDEKRNFSEFSERAKNIWNNKLDSEEFKKFTDLMEKKLTQRRLYDKQLLAAFHLAFSQNACNFSVPGSGKTSIVYGAYTYLKNGFPKNHPKYINKLLIIGPLSAFGPWEDEYKNCFGRTVTSKRLSGGVLPQERKRYLLSIAPAEETPELTLMSYQSIPYNLKDLKQFLQKEDHRVMMVLDEAHHIKNVEGGIQATSILNLAKYCHARVILTGTPAPNGYEDIFNLYEFIWPNKRIVGFNIYQLNDMTNTPYDERIPELIENISPFFVRIKKKDLDLPPVEETVITSNMGKIQREIYDTIENKYMNFFQENPEVSSAIATLTRGRFIRLMQAATNPNLLRRPLEEHFIEEGLSSELYINDSEFLNKIVNYSELEKIPKKFEIVKDMVFDLLTKNEKVVIWGIFIRDIEELQGYLFKNDIETRTLMGKTPIEMNDPDENIETREKIIREFHKPNSRFKVIIANPFAVSESISLHKACRNAIYLERDFNCTRFIQSKDRIHRVGLPKNTLVKYHYVVSSNSIDETIHNRLIEKERRMLELIERQEIPLLSENLDYDIDLKDDIKAIIRDYVKRTTQTR